MMQRYSKLYSLVFSISSHEPLQGSRSADMFIENNSVYDL